MKKVDEIRSMRYALRSRAEVINNGSLAGTYRTYAAALDWVLGERQRLLLPEPAKHHACPYGDSYCSPAGLCLSCQADARRREEAHVKA